MEDPRETAWRRRQDYHSRMSAIREAFAACYTQEIPNAQREAYYRSKLPKVAEWVTKRCAMERIRDGAIILGEGDIETRTHDELDVEEQMLDPVPSASRQESIVRMETHWKNPGLAECPSSSQRTLKRRAKPMKGYPASKLKQTNIEKLVCHGERDGLSATASSVMILDDTGQPPPESLPAVPSDRELPRPPQVVLRRTRGMRNGAHIPRTSPSTKKPRARPPQTASKTASKKSQTKIPASAKRTPKGKSNPKADSTVPYEAVSWAHPYDLYVLDVIFNRFPALYLRPRHKHRKCPASEKSLDIMMLIFRCRKAAARKDYRKGMNPNRENSIVRAGLGGGAVFLRRNVSRCKRVWAE